MMVNTLIAILISASIVSSAAIQVCPNGYGLNTGFKCTKCPDPNALDCVYGTTFSCYAGYQLTYTPISILCQPCLPLHWSKAGMSSGSLTKGFCVACSYQAASCDPTTGHITKCTNGGVVQQSIWGEVCYVAQPPVKKVP